MTPSELKSKISDLKQVANGLDEPEKSSGLHDIVMLETGLHGMALNEIVHQLGRISLSSQIQMDDLTNKARDVANAYNRRVQCFDRALGLLKAALGMVG